MVGNIFVDIKSIKYFNYKYFLYSFLYKSDRDNEK